MIGETRRRFRLQTLLALIAILAVIFGIVRYRYQRDYLSLVRAWANHFHANRAMLLNQSDVTQKNGAPQLSMKYGELAKLNDAWYRYYDHFAKGGQAADAPPRPKDNMGLNLP